MDERDALITHTFICRHLWVVLLWQESRVLVCCSQTSRILQHLQYGTVGAKWPGKANTACDHCTYSYEQDFQFGSVSWRPNENVANKVKSIQLQTKIPSSTPSDSEPFSKLLKFTHLLCSGLDSILGNLKDEVKGEE